ncbi:MAG: hypothetical protein RIC83_10690 [Alphaproteobacteria bacterium]
MSDGDQHNLDQQDGGGPVPGGPVEARPLLPPATAPDAGLWRNSLALLAENLSHWIGRASQRVRHRPPGRADVTAEVRLTEARLARLSALAGQPAFGGRIALLGMGRHAGLPLLLAWAGASVVVIERFDRRFGRQDQEAVAEALRQRYLSPRRRIRQDYAAAGETGDETAGDLSIHFGQAAQAVLAAAGPFDVILSDWALTADAAPLALLDAMAAALRPGGVMVHDVPLDAGTLFAGHHPLTFLTPGEAAWRLMSAASDRPARLRAPAYGAWLRAARAGGRLADGELRVCRIAQTTLPTPLSLEEATALADDDLRARAAAFVAPVRPRLARPFRGLGDPDLAISHITVTARRA